MGFGNRYRFVEQLLKKCGGLRVTEDLANAGTQE